MQTREYKLEALRRRQQRIFDTRLFMPPSPKTLADMSESDEEIVDLTTSSLTPSQLAIRNRPVSAPFESLRRTGVELAKQQKSPFKLLQEIYIEKPNTTKAVRFSTSDQTLAKMDTKKQRQKMQMAAFHRSPRVDQTAANELLDILGVTANTYKSPSPTKPKPTTTKIPLNKFDPISEEIKQKYYQTKAMNEQLTANIKILQNKLQENEKLLAVTKTEVRTSVAEAELKQQKLVLVEQQVAQLMEKNQALEKLLDIHRRPEETACILLSIYSPNSTAGVRMDAFPSIQAARRLVRTGNNKQAISQTVHALCKLVVHDRTAFCELGEDGVEELYARMGGVQ